MQLVELRADLAPDARFLRRVVDERRAEAFQPVLAAQGEQLLAPRDVLGVAEPGVARFQFEFGRRPAASPSPAGRWRRRIRRACSASFMTALPVGEVEEYSYSIGCCTASIEQRYGSGCDTASRRRTVRPVIAASGDYHESRILRNDRRARTSSATATCRRRARKRARCRVKVAAAAVNPIDTYIRAGAVPMPLPKPFITGCDLAGMVEAVGPGVTRFKAGDRVWGSNQGLLGRQGTFAEYACVDEEWLYPTPAGVATSRPRPRRSSASPPTSACSAAPKLEGRRDGVRQRRHRRRRLDGRADGEGRRREGHHHRRLAEKAELAARTGGRPRPQLQDRRRRRRR